MDVRPSPGRTLGETGETPLSAIVLSIQGFMPKEDAIRVRAQVLSPLGVAAYRMRLSNGHQLVAHVTRKLQPEIGPIGPGDFVDLELSPFDLSRGRILGRHGHRHDAGTGVEPFGQPIPPIRPVPPVGPIGPIGRIGD